MIYYIWTASVVFLVWMLIWSKSNWQNVLIKLLFAGMAVWGFYMAFTLSVQ